VISVIMPLGPHDGIPRKLIDDLGKSAAIGEILIAVPSGRNPEGGDVDGVSVVHASPGRASQMNAAAGRASGSHLWFLHADSVLGHEAIDKLLFSLERNPEAFWYHDLSFQKDGPVLMRLNEWGVRFRSDMLKMPFGDQGFCLPRSVFRQIGGYDETALYGEDHLLVWKARQQNVPVLRTGGRIQTSARKYRSGGWARITLLHVWLTTKQALPEFFKWLRRNKT
jgi:hypothetical protein